MRWPTTLLALFLTLGLAGLVCADESGNWFSRMFSLGSRKAEADKKKAEKDAEPQADDWTPGTPTAKPKDRQATQDWQRRLDVCTRLRAVAMEIGDLELEQKAEMLEKRVFEAYVASSNRNDLAKQKIGEVNLNEIRALEKSGKGKR